MRRSQFIKTVGGSSLVLTAIPLLSFGYPELNDPKLDKELVEIFVGKAHSNMGTIKEMLAEHPTLLNAAHDWKFGDFETALGAASHVGHKELVRYLLEQGAQANIFTAALFGKLEIVKSMIEVFPSTLHVKGPHGFTLLHHAEKGGEEAVNVVNYLKGLGATEGKINLY
jgi:hypothetical protein